MSTGMSKASSQDNFVAYIAAAVVVSLVAIFVFTWSHSGSVQSFRAAISYSKFGPYQVETQNFSISASVTVQTSYGDAAWPNNNRAALNAIFKKILAGTDMKILKAPNGMQKLQEALTEGCNAEMHSEHVQAVLLTDFVAAPRNS